MNKEKQERYDKVYMKIAADIAELSYAQRAKVGCIIVSEEGQILSHGFNGMPAGFDNCCETAECTNVMIYRGDGLPPYGEICLKGFDATECKDCKCFALKTKPEVLHAESNAISKCARYMSSTNGATLYVTLSPCMDCAKLIVQAGIRRVVYRDAYHDTAGVDFLRRAKIEVEQININSNENNTF